MRPKLNLLLGIYLFLSTNLLWAESNNAMQQPVDQLHNALIEIMQSANTSSFDERYIKMETVITSNFDTPLISRVVLSRYWKSLGEEKQADFIALFNRLTISTYVDRFNSFDGESFKHLSIEPMKKNRFLVKTELIQNNDDPVSFNYIVQQDNNDWKIISVIANGINDLSLKRGEYSSVIKEHGYDSLIESLKKKISDLHPKT